MAMPIKKPAETTRPQPNKSEFASQWVDPIDRVRSWEVVGSSGSVVPSICPALIIFLGNLPFVGVVGGSESEYTEFVI